MLEQQTRPEELATNGGLRIALLLPALLFAGCPEANGGSSPDPGSTAGPAATSTSTLGRIVAGTTGDEVAALEPPPRALRARSFAFAKPQPDLRQRAPQPSPSHSAPPLSLTASDGTGLALRSLTARAVIEAPLAFTELTLVFENPEDRVIEGRFQITLPPGATISRFAMKMADRWQEGEVVERQAARRAYEDFLHRRQDPALLEHEAGNAFSARVFPIPARGRKSLIISYSQTLFGPHARYLLPLKGLPEMGKLDLRVVVSRRHEAAKGTPAEGLATQKVIRETLTLQKEGWTPNEDFVVEAPEVPGRLGLRHENLVALRLSPIIGDAPEEITSLCVLFDSSASRALGFHPSVERLRKIARGLAKGAGKDTPLLVAAFDQSVAKIFEGPAGDFGPEAVASLRRHRALGASDLQQALVWLREAASDQETPCARVLVITDGVATAGNTEGDTLRAAVKALATVGVERLDALVQGGIRDTATLHALVTAGLPRDGVVIDGDDPLEEVARRLTERTASGLKLSIAGAKWIWPETLDGVQSGDEVLVFAGLPATAEVVVSLEGARLASDRLRLDGTERPLLERAWVQARIERLAHQRDTLAAGDDDLRAALKQQMIALSTKHRVLSPYTAFLVLETEADYARFGIDRTALSDILTVGDGGITLLHRGPESLLPAPPPIEARPEKTRAPMKKMRARNSAHREAAGDAATVDLAEAERGMDFAASAEAPATGSAQAPDDARLESDLEKEIRGEIDRRAPGAAAAPRPAATPPPRPPAEAPSPIPAPEASAPPADLPRGNLPRRTRLQAPDRLDDTDDGGQRQLPRRRERPKKNTELPWSGNFLRVKRLLRAGKAEAALEKASGWREEAPGDVLALVALGEAFEAHGDLESAARAYGSIIDLFPSRADLRRYAGEHLEALARGAGLALAADTYQKAVSQRPDHPAGHRLLAFALLRLERFEEAFAALEAGLARDYPAGRFAAAKEILGEDLALLGAAWAAARPAQKKKIQARLAARGVRPEDAPSLRFVLVWETDANDVDFHIYDARGGHAFYSQPRLPDGGGRLYADVTTGYGPECFTIRGKKRAGPYTLQAHYYSRGPMGYGMGLLQILDHDGRGKITIEARPFVVMKDGAFLDLGTIK